MQTCKHAMGRREGRRSVLVLCKLPLSSACNDWEGGGIWVVVTITPFDFSHFDTVDQPNEGMSIAHSGDLGTTLEGCLNWNTLFGDAVTAGGNVVKNFHLKRRKRLSVKA